MFRFPFLVLPILAATSGFSGETKLLPSGAAPYATFGASIVANGEFLAIGAPGDSLTADRSGVVYVYHSDGRQWRLAPSDGVAGTSMGVGLAMDGNLLVAGVSGGNGGAYVYRFNGSIWVEEFRLRYRGGTSGTGYFGFGRTVAASGNCFVLSTSAHVYDDRLEPSGIALMYCTDGTAWSFRGAFGPGFVGGSDHFGRSVALQGNLLLVGGASRIYQYLNDGTAWREQPRIMTGGTRIALDGTRLLTSGGSGVLIFQRTSTTGWTQTAKLEAPGKSTGSNFGAALALSGNRAVVGAPSYSQGPGEINGAGAAFVYRLSSSGWALETPLYTTESKSGATRSTVAIGFGSVVSVLRDRVAVSLVSDSTLGTRVGAVYLFTPPWPTYPNVDEDGETNGGPPPHAGGPPPGGGKPK
jgi:hypothetical protein